MDQVLSLVPVQAKSQMEQLLNTSKVSIKITKKRQTKHGDFRKQRMNWLILKFPNRFNTEQNLTVKSGRMPTERPYFHF